jgi:hypothetical protein
VVGTRPPGSVKQSPFEICSLFHTVKRKIYAIHVRNRPYSGTGELFANVPIVRVFLRERTEILATIKEKQPLLERSFDVSI